MPRRGRRNNNNRGGRYPVLPRVNRRWNIYGGAAEQLWRDVMYLKSVINVEKKFADYTFSAAVSSTENFQLVNGLQQGDTASTREGQSIKIYSLYVRFYMTINASATTTQIRIFVLMDKQPNGAVPTSGDLLQSNTNILSPLLMGYGSRFKIFMDKVYRLDTNKLNLTIKKFFKFRFHTKYGSGNAGTVADITKNSLYIMMVSDQATNTPNIDFWARLRYIDN